MHRRIPDSLKLCGLSVLKGQRIEDLVIVNPELTGTEIMNRLQALIELGLVELNEEVDYYYILVGTPGR